LKTKAKRIDRRTRKLKLKGPRSKTYVIHRPYYDLFDTEMLEERDVERMFLKCGNRGNLEELRNTKYRFSLNTFDKRHVSEIFNYDRSKSKSWDALRPFNVERI